MLKKEIKNRAKIIVSPHFTILFSLKNLTFKTASFLNVILLPNEQLKFIKLSVFHIKGHL